MGKVSGLPMAMSQPAEVAMTPTAVPGVRRNMGEQMGSSGSLPTALNGADQA